MRFHSFRDLSPARTGVEGLRSHSRGKALRALIGVKLNELSVGGFVVALEKHAMLVSTIHGGVDHNKGPTMKNGRENQTRNEYRNHVEARSKRGCRKKCDIPLR